MKVLVKKEGWEECPYWIDIPCTYEAFRELVEGDWNMAPTRVKGVFVVYDEKASEKRSYNMCTWEMNRQNPQNVYIAGIAVFAGYAEGTFVEMTRLQKKEVFDKYFVGVTEKKSCKTWADTVKIRWWQMLLCFQPCCERYKALAGND